MTHDLQGMIDKTVEMNMKLYPAQPIMLTHGQGCCAYDTQGREYLDFAIGYAVASLGHAHPKVVQTIADQAGKMMICQGSYVSQAKYEASRVVIENSIFDELYFMNSGAECVELALKMARKWSYDTKGAECNEFITFHNAFHGRTYGASSVTEKCNTQPFFAPYLPGVHFATLNDLASVEALISQRTAGVILEPVQGEGGLNPVDSVFLAGLRRLCDQYNVPLIFDEIQCGAGRLGTLFAYESFLDEDGKVIEPDIIAMAKGVGSGFPVGLVAAKKTFSSAMVAGTHGSTYGGNPLACAVVATVMGEISQPAFLQHVRAMSDLLAQELEALKARSNKIKRITGKGLMIGIETDAPVKDMIATLQKNGLLVTQAGASLVRITPPLIVQADQIKKAVSIIEQTLQNNF